MSDTHVGALLVAAGHGSRMRLDEPEQEPERETEREPKQFQDLAGRMGCKL